MLEITEADLVCKWMEKQYLTGRAGMAMERSVVGLVSSQPSWYG